MQIASVQSIVHVTFFDEFFFKRMILDRDAVIILGNHNVHGVTK